LGGATGRESIPRLLVAAIVAFALWSHLWGIRGDLPWTYGSDEGQFAVLAIRMAANGDPNPRWFGHPGSPFVYPLALVFHVGNALEAGLPLLQHDPGLAARVGGNPGKFFALGRLISVAYAVASLPLLYLIGRRTFDATTAVAATWLASLSPLSLTHAQMLRTDSAGLFFGLLALWLTLRMLDHPSRGAHALAGLAIGAAVGTRYFLATLAPVLACADLVLASRLHGRPAERRRLLGLAVLGLACVALGFALTTPYFIIDFPTVWKNLAHEMREEHLGADGQGFVANLAWYSTTALAASMPLTWLAAALAGVALAAWRRNAAAALVALSVAGFVVAISTASLHWQRWLIQVLPLVALFAAVGLVALARALAGLTRGGAGLEAALVVLLTVLVSAQPALAYVEHGLLQARPSTRIAAREWMEANVPPGSTIAADFYTAPLHETRLHADYHFSLAADGELEEYRRAGYDYVMVSDAIYGRYLREPERYPREVAFYETLLRSGRLVKRFAPREFGRGPTITLYALRPESEPRVEPPRAERAAERERAGE
jgi:4-amino-4-deoxy-L-arabinose transferase-like glycosyltransferase